MRTRPPSTRVLTVRLTEADLEALERFCLANRLSKTGAVLSRLRDAAAAYFDGDD